MKQLAEDKKKVWIKNTLKFCRNWLKSEFRLELEFQTGLIFANNE